MEQNAIKLVGDVVRVAGTTVTILTKQVRPGGVYEDEHVVEIPDVTLTQDLKPKQKIGLMGYLARGDSAFSTRIIADTATVKKLAKSAGYENMAKLVGKIPMSASMLPAAEGKTGLANLVIEVAGQMFNGVAFRQTAIMLSRAWHKGAIGQLMGRLRRREFIDRNGDIQTSIEVVAEDSAETRILKRAEENDPFGDFGKLGVDAQPEPATGPAI